MTALRLRYQTIEFGSTDIHLRTLRDSQEFCDQDGEAAALGICDASWGLFGVVWPSGLALAQLMSEFDVAGKRILEVGCGIGLASVVLNARRADITATDHHPRAHEFLDFNTELNNDPAIPFVQTAWTNDDEHELGTFDLIIGSDLLYERDHPNQLAEFIADHGKPTSETIIVDPRRGNISRFKARMRSLGYSYATRKLSPTTHPSYAGTAHSFTR